MTSNWYKTFSPSLLVYGFSCVFTLILFVGVVAGAGVYSAAEPTY